MQKYLSSRYIESSVCYATTKILFPIFVANGVIFWAIRILCEQFGFTENILLQRQIRKKLIMNSENRNDRIEMSTYQMRIHHQLYVRLVQQYE